MKANVGTIDRVLRIIVGLVLIGLALAGTIGPWGWIGVVPLATALFRFCPLYTVLGMNPRMKHYAGTRPIWATPEGSKPVKELLA